MIILLEDLDMDGKIVFSGINGFISHIIYINQLITLIKFKAKKI